MAIRNSANLPTLAGQLGQPEHRFQVSQEVRRPICTTNAIEGSNRQLRKVTKAKSVSPTDNSLLKMLYLTMMEITKKWTGRRQEWSLIHAQMAIYFAGRMPEQPRRRYVVKQVAAGFPRCRPE